MMVGPQQRLQQIDVRASAGAVFGFCTQRVLSVEVVGLAHRRECQKGEKELLAKRILLVEAWFAELGGARHLSLSLPHWLRVLVRRGRAFFLEVSPLNGKRKFGENSLGRGTKFLGLKGRAIRLVVSARNVRRETRKKGLGRPGTSERIFSLLRAQNAVL